LANKICRIVWLFLLSVLRKIDILCPFYGSNGVDFPMGGLPNCFGSDWIDWGWAALMKYLSQLRVVL